ncbi:MAG: VanZ family protein [Bacteroidota bacterium]
MTKWVFLWRILSLIWAALIIVAALIHFRHIDNSPWSSLPYADKYAHFLLYSVFSFLTFLGFQNSFKKLWKLTAVTIAYAISIEFIHLIIPYRTFELFDIVANGFGTIIGILAFYIMKNLLAKPLFLKN